MKTKLSKVDVTKYADINASGDPGKDQKKNSAALVKVFVEGGKVAAGVYDDTAILMIPQELGLFKAKSKNIEEDNKIKANLKDNGLASDPLTVGISKIIKAKVENNSTPGTSSEEIDDMLIKIMEDIEEEEKLLDSTEDSSDDAVEEIEAIIDIVSHIEGILKINNKLADQKIIDIKSNLNKAESEKKYLQGIVEAHEDAEKEGGILGSTQGITAIKARLEEAEKTINGLKEELQQHEGEPAGVAEEEVIEGQDTEGALTDEDNQDALTEEEESEETTEETVESIIILNGTISAPDMDNQKMSMTINLETGSVTGILYIRFDNGTIWFNIDTPFSGTINSETRAINAATSGDDDDEGLKLTGILSADGNRANGTGDEGMIWSVSR